MKTLMLALSPCLLTACAMDEIDADATPTATDEQSMIAALPTAQGMLPGAAEDADDASAAAAASAETPLMKGPGGEAKRGTFEIPMSVDAGEGVSTADVIICTVTASGWYAGNGQNYADGFVLCPATEDSIYITFEWYNHNTGALMRTSGKPPCFGKNACGKSDGFESYAFLDVAVCAMTVKVGYTTGYGCAWVGPF